jgi:tRNA(fMet)-specific endonuclease VapC
MSARFLLDTNICIYLWQRRTPEIVARFRGLKQGEAVMSVVTQGELHYGVERSQFREKSLRALEELAELIPVLSLPGGAGVEYGRIRSELERRGSPIGNNDMWIAAHAKAEHLVLVTNNEREFRRIGGLQVENWTSRK